MPDQRAEALRSLRGELSVRAFHVLLAKNGLAPGRLSRHRLGDLEEGAHVPLAVWEEIADALAAAGKSADEVEPLRSAEGLIAPPPPSTPDLRLRQWSRIVARVAGNRWWSAPLALAQRVTSATKAVSYLQLLDRHGGSREQLEQVRLRLELGRTIGPFEPVVGDEVRIDPAASTLQVQLDHGDLFVLSARLHNTGTVPWRNRLLFRLGTPVSSSLPLTPGVLPVPDTDPGGFCDLIVPGRAHWFLNLAAVSYVMVFPDLSYCVTGRIVFQVDTRSTEYEQSYQLPPGFPGGDGGPG
ncbi:hypothetical protein AB0E63_42715 [Kribbella sp. NPDC026596]|uniref:hypothetical protein n=1 Tax=Kribbella sp. NPDC026596 TaxID=3155122 RepID=UPI0034049455